MTPHPFHYCLEQAIDLVKVIKPKKARFVGMTGEFDYDDVNAMLAQRSKEVGVDMAIAHDGLFVQVEI
jgi:phosphoribosyl 1,2-cyclic phosphodiesterase